MSIENLKEGQRVRFTVEGTLQEVHRVAALSHGNSLVVQRDDGYHYFIPASAITEIVSEVPPANWPPQIYDVWETGAGDLYFVRSHTYTKGVPVVVPFEVAGPAQSFSDRHDAADSKLTAFLALKPELRYRRAA